MALVLKDRVKETTTTTGTGTITLAGAVAGFAAFSTVGDGNTTYYAIVAQTPGEWEVGIGTYTASGTTLARNTVLASSNSGSAVNFSAGTKDVFVTYPAGTSVVASNNSGTSGQVLTSNGSGVAPTWQTAGGGGGALTISNKTAAYTVVAGDAGTIINCTSGTFTVSLTAAATLGAGFNCWIWNTGTGAITIDPNASETIDGVATLILRQGEGTQIVCDGTNWQTGGKKTMRGYAENYLSTATRPVAITGNNAIAVGNSYASGTDSFAAAGNNNTGTYGALGANAIAMSDRAKASGGQSVAIGQLSTASAVSSIAISGYYANASGLASIAMGSNYYIGTPTASGGSSVAIGDGTMASQKYSTALGAGATSVIYGKYAYAGGLFSTAGDSQSGTSILRKATTDATATVITADNGAASAINQVTLPNNSAYTFTGIVVARQQAAGGTASAAWKVEGLIRREATAGTTTLVASTVTAISNVPGWTLALSADTTNGGLAVTATGAAATNIRWVATINTSEVTYA